MFEAQNQLQTEHQEHGDHDVTNNRSDIIPPISGTSEVIASDVTTSENVEASTASKEENSTVDKKKLMWYTVNCVFWISDNCARTR